MHNGHDILAYVIDICAYQETFELYMSSNCRELCPYHILVLFSMSQEEKY